MSDNTKLRLLEMFVVKLEIVDRERGRIREIECGAFRILGNGKVIVTEHRIALPCQVISDNSKGLVTHDALVAVLPARAGDQYQQLAVELVLTGRISQRAANRDIAHSGVRKLQLHLFLLIREWRLRRLWTMELPALRHPTKSQRKLSPTLPENTLNGIFFSIITPQKRRTNLFRLQTKRILLKTNAIDFDSRRILVGAVHFGIEAIAPLLHCQDQSQGILAHRQFTLPYTHNLCRNKGREKKAQKNV